MLLVYDHKPDITRWGSTREKAFSLHSDLDPDWAYLFGYFIGDGCLELRGGRATWIVQDAESLSMKVLLESKFGLEFSCSPHKSKKAILKRIDIYSVGVVRFLTCLGFQHGAHNKIIPPFLCEGAKDPDLRKALLQGLFDSDGTVFVEKDPRSVNRLGCRIALGLTSCSVVSQVYEYLCHLGMSPSLVIERRSLDNPDHHDLWRVVLCSRADNFLFYSKVGFRLKSKQTLLEEFLRKTGKLV